jgi:hypothetical protein
MIKKIITAIFMISILPCSTFATEQTPDIILHEGKIYHLLNGAGKPCFPLNAYYKNKNIKVPKFRRKPSPKGMDTFLSTNNWRGYVATWEIKNNLLFLKNIDAFIDEEKADLKKLFHEDLQNGSVPALWYSGKIKIMSPDREFLFFEVENAKVKEKTQISFSNEPIVKLSEALSLAQEYIKEKNIDISKHYLDNARLLFDSTWMDGKHWIITWKLKTPSNGGEIFIFVGMDKKIRMHKGI